jgi:hypothetical protein
MNYSKLYVALTVLLFFSCTKNKQDDPLPSATGDYNWKATALRALDTLTVENSGLYYSAEGLNLLNATQQFTLTWLKGGLDSDFEMTITYENLNTAPSNFNSPFNAPFGFFFYPDGDITKQTNVNLGTNYTLIQYGNKNPSSSYDFKTSHSGTVVVKRVGSNFTISLTKDYLNGSTPAQFVQQKDSVNWFSGKTNFNFVVQNNLTNQRSRCRWTSMTIKNAEGVIIESFDTKSISTQ